MGLDLTWIILDCEEKFGITIEEDYRLSTVGSLYHYILCAVERVNGPCPTVAVFFRLRNALLRHMSLKKEAIRPETPLATLLPRWRKRRLWNIVRQETRLELPGLPGLLPSWLHLFLSVVLGIGLSATCFYLLGVTLHGMGVTPLSETLEILSSGAFAILVFAFPCAFAIALALPTRIPGNWSLAHVVDLYLKEHPAAFGPDGDQWDADSVWSTLRGILTRILDVPPETITPDAHFIKDLRAN